MLNERYGTYVPQRDSELEDQEGSSDGDGRGGKKDGKGDKEKKGGINRVNRACNNCRRMKMRCVGAEDPPCKRCRNGNLECVMEKPGKGADGGGDDRIRSLESQVSAIQSTLTDLVSTLRAGMSGGGDSSSSSSSKRDSRTMSQMQHSQHQQHQHQQAHSQSPNYSNPFDMSTQQVLANMGVLPAATTPSPHGSTFDPTSLSGGYSNNPGMTNSSFPGNATLFGGNGVAMGSGGGTTHRSPSYSAFPPGTVNFGFPPRQDVMIASRPGEGSDTASVGSFGRNQPSPYNMISAADTPGGSGMDQSGMDSGFRIPNVPNTNPGTAGYPMFAQAQSQSQLNRRSGQGQSMTPQAQAQAQTAPRALPPPGSHSNSHMSLPPSRAGSVGADDIFGTEEIINPLGALSNMAGLVEAAVERAREEEGGKQPRGEGGEGDGSGSGSGLGANNTSTGKRQAEGGDASRSSDAAATAAIGGEGGEAGDGGDKNDSRPRKKTRFSPVEPSGPVVVESQNLPPISTSGGRGKPRVKKAHIHAYPDAVAEGIINEADGKEMMSIFYAGSSNFIPCYDPARDTWEALRERSPFSITTIIMVGARVRDGGGPISDVQRQCRQHAQRIGVGTLFNPVARIEAVQAMILLAAFSENGWLPGGHAVRMAIDMGINRSFIHLLRSGMGKGKSPEELEEERHLVVHSRVWFCLYLMEHQMAYGMGRPAILREDESIHQCRRLLEHPLSITSDARLVSTVELTALRAPLHIELTAAPDLPIAEHTLRRLKQANADFDAWERYWDRILSDRFGKGRGDFFRESLIIQRQYAELFVNSQLLRGVRETQDVVNMPEEKRALAIRAMRNAQRCLEICLRGENYRNGLRYAVHYTHVCAAFAASFLLRIARLFPNELNLKKTAKDVEELAGVLSDIPAGRYARSLRLILRRARRAKVIPAASVMPSPTRTSLALPGVDQHTPAAAQTTTTIAFSPSQLVNPSYYPTPSASGQSQSAMQSGPPNMSPSSMLLNATQIINDSPSSGNDFFEFDQLFAQETLEKAGLTLGEGDQLPLFLDGQSLGGTQAQGDMTPFVGIESFFLPAEVDHRLGGLGNTTDGTGAGASGGLGNENPLGGDVWW